MVGCGCLRRLVVFHKVVGSVRGRQGCKVRLYGLLLFLIEELFDFIYGLIEGCLVLRRSGGLPPIAQLSLLHDFLFYRLGTVQVYMGEWVWGGWVEFQAACWMVWTIVNICVKNQQIHQLFIQLAFHEYFYWEF
jgi:hypothetical protein